MLLLFCVPRPKVVVDICCISNTAHYLLTEAIISSGADDLNWVGPLCPSLPPLSQHQVSSIPKWSKLGGPPGLPFTPLYLRTKYRVPKTKYQVYQVPSTKYHVYQDDLNWVGPLAFLTPLISAPSTKYQIPSTKYTKYQVPSTSYTKMI